MGSATPSGLQSLNKLLELFAVRRMLESQATGLAAGLATDDDARSLIDAVASVDPETVSIDDLVAHDTHFHGRVVDLAGNGYLASLIDGLSSQTIRARVWRGLTEQGAVARTLSEHQAIAEAIANHDSTLAASLATAHVAGVERWLRQAATA